MIELRQFRPFWGLPNASPFCMKVEAYLRYRNYDYRIIPSTPRKSPTNQVPFIKIGDELIADSQKIIERLEQQQAEPMDAELTPRQKSEAAILRQLFEGHLFWHINFMRWGDPKGWEVFSRDMHKQLPFVMRIGPLQLIRKRLIRNMKMAGLTPHKPDQAYEKGIAILAHLENWLGENRYFISSK